MSSAALGARDVERQFRYRARTADPESGDGDVAKWKVFGSGDQSAEGVPGRAVCRWARCGLSPGQRATRTRTKIELTLADGSSATLVEGLPWKLAVALCGW